MDTIQGKSVQLTNYWEVSMKALKHVSLLCLVLGTLGASALKDMVENASVDGWARGKYLYSDGRDGYGYGYQMFFLPTVHSGKVNGYNISVGIFASYGPGVPDNVNSNDAIGGSRAHRISAATDVFNISNLYVNKSFEESGSKTDIRVGQMNIATVFTDKGVDRGIGAMVSNQDIEGIKLYLSAYDTWITDNIYLGMGQATPYGIGNDVVFFGVETDDKRFAVKNLGFKAWYGFGEGLFDLMMFGDIHYKIEFESGVSLGFLGQIAGMIMNDKPVFLTKGTNLKKYFDEVNKDPKDGIAKTRGVFNLQANLKAGGYTSKLGFVQSFAQGYGALLNSKGGFDVGGQIWNGIVSGGLMGFGWIGTGGVKNTDLTVAYFSNKYKWQSSGFGIGLDIAYVGGHNRYPYMQKASQRIRTSGHDRGGVIPSKEGSPAKPATSSTPAEPATGNRTADSQLVEISPQINYSFTKNFNGSIVYSQMMGDMSLGRTVVTLKYDF